MTYKFNSGYGAVVCDVCSVILKEPASADEVTGTDLCGNCRLRVQLWLENTLDVDHKTNPEELDRKELRKFLYESRKTA